MLQDGVASAEDIDRAMVIAYRHPIGPCASATSSASTCASTSRDISPRARPALRAAAPPRGDGRARRTRAKDRQGVLRLEGRDFQLNSRSLRKPWPASSIVPRRHRRTSSDVARERRQTGGRLRPALFPGCRQARGKAGRTLERAREGGLPRRAHLRRNGGGGSGLADYNVIVEETRGAGLSRSFAGDRLDLRADHRAARRRGAEARMAAGPRERRAPPRLRDHRTQRGHQHPQGQHRRARRGMVGR